MTTPTPTSPAVDNPLRWMVRLELVRDARFGERSRDTLQWAVTPYLGRRSDGQLIGGFVPTYFASSRAAHAYARRQAERVYGRKR